MASVVMVRAGPGFGAMHRLWGGKEVDSAGVCRYPKKDAIGIGIRAIGFANGYVGDVRDGFSHGLVVRALASGALHSTPAGFSGHPYCSR